MYGMGQVRFTRDTFLKHLEYLRERREELQLCSTGNVDCMKKGTALLKTNGKIEATGWDWFASNGGHRLMLPAVLELWF